MAFCCYCFSGSFWQHSSVSVGSVLFPFRTYRQFCPGGPGEHCLSYSVGYPASAPSCGGTVWRSSFRIWFSASDLFANPIAGPFVFGHFFRGQSVVALVMILFLGKVSLWAPRPRFYGGFAGSVISMGFVSGSQGGCGRCPCRVVCGVMISYICSAITDLWVTFADDSNIVNLHNWSMGSFPARPGPGAGDDGGGGFLCLCCHSVWRSPSAHTRLGEEYARSPA